MLPTVPNVVIAVEIGAASGWPHRIAEGRPRPTPPTTKDRNLRWGGAETTLNLTFSQP